MMKRRDFLKSSMVAGVTPLVDQVVGAKPENDQGKKPDEASTPPLVWLVRPDIAGNLTLHQLEALEPRDGWIPIRVTGYDAPHFDTDRLKLDANRYVYLYLILHLPSPAQFSLFFQKEGDTAYSSNRMGMIQKPIYTEEPQALRLDLGDVPEWKGAISRMRLQFEGMLKGSEFKVGGLALSTGKLERIGEPSNHTSYSVTRAELTGPYKGERMVACCRTVLSMDEVSGAVGLSTYIDQPLNSQSFMIPSAVSYDPQKQIALVKLKPSMERDGKTVPTSQAASVDVMAYPGRLIADYRHEAVGIHLEALPLRSVCDTAEAEGAMLFKIASRPSNRVVVECGGMAVMGVFQREAWLRDAVPGNAKNQIKKEGGLAVLRDPSVERVVVLKSSAPLMVAAVDVPHARIEFPAGEGWILATFARSADRAVALAGVDIATEENNSREFYAGLLNRIHIKTPEAVMDEAFQAAVLNMEYTWVRPFGCTESLHHWWALWQQYPTAVFDWIGFHDRSKMCIESHATRQYKSGDIPYLLEYGERHLDFGGNNQTFMWQVQHYLRTSNDGELAARLAQCCRRVVAAYYREEDANDNGIPGFGVQILTQEDYVSTPHEGTSPAVEGIEMLRTLALVERLAGNRAAAVVYEARAQGAITEFLSGLWQKDLGRPAYFRDDIGNIRPDGQYHTLVLPVVYRVLDPLSDWTSIRHLRDRLTGPSGEIFCSNNFPNHMSGVKGSPFGPTWGMQAGAYAQPWGAWGLNRVGLYNEAYRPLLLAAKWAMMFPKLGAWEESSTELTPAYFTNTAANYALGIIEAIFGFELDLPENVLNIQPAIPEAWGEASISLDQLQARYSRSGNLMTYSVSTTIALRRCVRWPLPVARIDRVTVNGQVVEFSVEPGVNGIWLNFETAALKSTEIAIQYSPLDWKTSSPGSIAEGEDLQVATVGCRIEGVEDPCGVLKGCEFGDDKATLKIATGLLDHWLRFGRLGQLNFSRRSIFLRCIAQTQPFWAAVDFALLPSCEAAPARDLIRGSLGYGVQLSVRNNTNKPIMGESELILAGRTFSTKIDLQPRSDGIATVDLAPDPLDLLTPGDNDGELRLPNGKILQVRCPVAAPFADKKLQRERLESLVRNIELPSDSLVEDSQWKDFAAFPAFWQGPYNEFPPPLQAVAGRAELTCEEIPGIQFPLRYGRKLALASHRQGRPTVRINLDQKLRKIYLVTLAFVENHDTFTECARVDVACELSPDSPSFDASEEPTEWTKTRYHHVVFRRALTTPGDLDSFFAEYHAGPQATARLRRPSRYGLLSLLKPSTADWPEGVPFPSPYGLLPLISPPPRNHWPEGEYRSYPQPQYWAGCPAIRTDSSTFNVVEIDLRQVRRVQRIEVTSTLQDTAFGVVSIVGLEAEH